MASSLVAGVQQTSQSHANASLKPWGERRMRRGRMRSDDEDDSVADHCDELKCSGRFKHDVPFMWERT